MTSVVSTSNFVRRLPMMLIGALACFLPFGAGAHTSPNIEVCNHCSTDWQYSQAAFSASDLSPGQSGVVYVVNFSLEETRVYNVAVVMIDSGGFDSFAVEVTPISGDPSILSDLATAAQALKDFGSAFVEDIPAQSLELPPTLGSAAQLIGSPFFQQALQNQLTSLFQEEWQTGVLLQLMQVGMGALGIVVDVEELDILPDRVVVVFPDGTKVEVDIEGTGRDFSDPATLIVDFEVDESSIRDENNTPIPRNADMVGDYASDDVRQDLAQEIAELAARFGFDVVWGAGASQCATTSWRCEQSTNTCTVTASC